jgi:hypothetical protein
MGLHLRFQLEVENLQGLLRCRVRNSCGPTRSTFQRNDLRNGIHDGGIRANGAPRDPRRIRDFQYNDLSLLPHVFTAEMSLNTRRPRRKTLTGHK